jgi:hypothetical protein
MCDESLMVGSASADGFRVAYREFSETIAYINNAAEWLHGRCCLSIEGEK